MTTLAYFQKVPERRHSLIPTEVDSDCGVLYVVYDDETFLTECYISILSLKMSDPNIKVALCTNFSHKKILSHAIYAVLNQYVYVDIQDKGTNEYAKKPYFLKCSPWTKTIYLDTDTIVLNPVSPLFELLDRFAIAVVPAFWDQRPAQQAFMKACGRPVVYDDVPQAFDNVNSGVMAFVNNSKTKDCFEMWTTILEKQIKVATDFNIESITFCGAFSDEQSLTEALYKSKEINLCLLSSSWNRRIAFYQQPLANVFHCHVFDNTESAIKRFKKHFDEIRDLVGTDMFRADYHSKLEKLLKKCKSV